MLYGKSEACLDDFAWVGGGGERSEKAVNCVFLSNCFYISSLFNSTLSKGNTQDAFYIYLYLNAF